MKNKIKIGAKIKMNVIETKYTDAAQIIQKGLTLLNRRFDRALNSEADLDILIDEIFAADKTELTQNEKDKQAKILLDEIGSQFAEQNETLKRIENKVNALLVQKRSI